MSVYIFSYILTSTRIWLHWSRSRSFWSRACKSCLVSVLASVFSGLINKPHWQWLANKHKYIKFVLITVYSAYSQKRFNSQQHNSLNKQCDYRHRGPKHKHQFVCQYVAPLVSVITTLYYVAIIFHRWVWYRALSLRYACIRTSGVILIPCAIFVPNFVSFVASIAELAHGEKLCTQSLTQSLTSLFDAPWTKALELRKNDNWFKL